MKVLTSNEIFRTAFEHVNPKGINSPFGYTHANKDKNEMCPYCKNEDTEVVVDEVYLKPFKDFYKDVFHKVVHCSCCTAVFSFYKR